MQSVKRQIGVSVSYDAGMLTLVDEDGVSVLLPIVGEVAKNPQKMQETFVKQISKTGESDFYIEDVKIASELPFMPVSSINQLRRDAFEELMKKRLFEYKRQTQKKMNYTPYYKQELDYRANVYNKEAEEFYNLCGAKVREPALEKRMPERSVELMRTKHCIKYALNMCKSPLKLRLRDEFGKVYPLVFDCKACEMCVMKPLQ